MTSQLDAADRRSASRVKHGTRVWFVLGALGLSGLLAGFATSRSSATRWWLFAAGAPLGAALGVAFRRDRCSVCKAGLPVRVFDDACPACGNPIVALVVVDGDGDRRVELPVRAPRTADGERHDRVPYRAGSTAARDAAEDAQDDTRTDVDGRVARLRAEPAIAKAIADKDELALYQLVRARRGKACSVAEEAALDALLADPRRRLAPKRRPWLGARLGSGLVLAAPRDQDRKDGSFIADQLLVLGTYSIVPLGTYLARRPAAGGVEILGGLPLPGWKRVWRASVGALAAAVIALGAHGLVVSRTSVVHVLNGLDVPVTTRAPDGSSVTVPPMAVRSFEVARGRQPFVTVDASGRWIEEVEVDVPGGDALVVYDVVGATAVRRQELFYTVASEVPGDLGNELIVGQRAIIRPAVTYAFSSAPRSIRSSGGQGTFADRGDHRVWQAVAILGGWRSARAEMVSELDAIELLQAVALAEPEEEDAVREALQWTLYRRGRHDAEALVDRLWLRAPQSPAVKAAAARLDAAVPVTPR